MENIDPFSAPPLVEWENCVTHEEITSSLTHYVQIYNNTPRWRFIRRLMLFQIVVTLDGIDSFIHQKQKDTGDMYGKKH